MTPERREAKRVYWAAWYQDHREERRAYKATYNAAHGEERRAYDAAYGAAHRDEIRGKSTKFHEWLQILRTNNGCGDCETHEGRFDHHHVDPATKLYSVSQMYSRSLDALEDELEKCVVLCDPCHRTRHVEMRAA